MSESTTIDNAVEFKDKLNPKLWNDWKLDKDVAKHLKFVADEFIKWLAIPLDVKDIWVLGSQASFNWTDSSDVDVHIYVDLSNFKDKKTTKELLETKTKLFKKLFPIKVYGIPIELTVEDDSNRATSPGIYSLEQNKWIKKPKKVDEEEVEDDKDRAARLSGIWKKRIKAALQNKEIDSHDLNDLKDTIKDQRRKALKKDGEFSDGNIAFKDLRKTGYIDKIKNVRDSKFKKELTLPEK